jgi:hypothetical protein
MNLVNFCPECANPIIENDMPFCPKCGVKLPFTSPATQPYLIHQQALQQPVNPLSYNPQATTLPRSFTEFKRNDMPFHYSIIFYIVIIWDLITCLLFSSVWAYQTFFDMSSSYYLSPLSIYLIILLLLNFGMDIIILKNMRNSPDRIDINSCWIKSLLGFLGIVTFIFGLYFFIISLNMKRAHNARTKLRGE